MAVNSQVHFPVALPQWIKPRCPSESRLDGPPSLCWGQINLLFLTGTELPIFGPPVLSILTIPIALPRLLMLCWSLVRLSYSLISNRNLSTNITPDKSTHWKDSTNTILVLSFSILSPASHCCVLDVLLNTLCILCPTFNCFFYLCLYLTDNTFCNYGRHSRCSTFSSPS
jgi:hypothetical protein